MGVCCRRTRIRLLRSCSLVVYVRGTTRAAEVWTDPVGLSVSHPGIQRPTNSWRWRTGRMRGWDPLHAESYSSSTRLPPPHSVHDRSVTLCLVRSLPDGCVGVAGRSLFPPLSPDNLVAGGQAGCMFCRWFLRGLTYLSIVRGLYYTIPID